MHSENQNISITNQTEVTKVKQKRPKPQPGMFAVEIYITPQSTGIAQSIDESLNYLDSITYATYAQVAVTSSQMMDSDNIDFIRSSQCVSRLLDMTTISNDIAEDTPVYSKIISALSHVKLEIPAPLQILHSNLGKTEYEGQVYLREDLNNLLAGQAISIAKHASPQMKQGGATADHPTDQINFDSYRFNSSGELCYTRHGSVANCKQRIIAAIIADNANFPTSKSKNNAIQDILTISQYEDFDDFITKSFAIPPASKQMLIGITEANSYPLLPDNQRDQVRTLFNYARFDADHPVPMKNITQKFDCVKGWCNRMYRFAHSSYGFLKIVKPTPSLIRLVSIQDLLVTAPVRVSATDIIYAIFLGSDSYRLMLFEAAVINYVEDVRLQVFENYTEFI
jgi:hypothetical protein